MKVTKIESTVGGFHSWNINHRNAEQATLAPPSPTQLMNTRRSEVGAIAKGMNNKKTIFL